jgi:hypothetical protein
MKETIQMNQQGEDFSPATDGLRDWLIVFAVATLVAAIVLEFTHIDAGKAWDAFSGVVGLLVGQHMPKPKSAPKVPFTRR